MNYDLAVLTPMSTAKGQALAIRAWTFLPPITGSHLMSHLGKVLKFIFTFSNRRPKSDLVDTHHPPLFCAIISRPRQIIGEVTLAASPAMPNGYAAD